MCVCVCYVCMCVVLFCFFRKLFLLAPLRGGASPPSVVGRPDYGDSSIAGVNAMPGECPSLIKRPVWAGPFFGVWCVLLCGWVVK